MTYLAGLTSGKTSVLNATAHGEQVLLLTHYGLIMRRVVLLMVAGLLGFLPGVVGAQNFWEPANGPIWGQVQCLAFDSAGGIIVGTNEGDLFRSRDEGTTWRHIFSAVSYNTRVGSIAVSPNGHIFTVSGGGVFRSMDRGDSWQELTSGLSPYGGGGLAAAANGNLFLSAQGGLCSSTDDGVTWVQILKNFAASSIAVSPSGRVFASNGVLISTTDNGGSWREDTNQQFYRYPHGQVISNFTVGNLAMHPNGRIFACSDGGVISFDTGTGSVYTVPNGPLPYWYKFSSFTIARNGDIFGSGADIGESNALYCSHNGGFYWDSISSVTPHPIVISPSDHLFGAALDGIVGVSTDAGKTWRRVGNGLPGYSINALVASGNRMVLASFDYRLVRSRDGGDTWALSDSGIDRPEIISMASCPSGSLVAFAAYRGIFRSTDDGSSWTLPDSSTADYYVHCFLVTPNSQIFAGTENGAYRSDDDGKSWRRLNLDSMSVLSLATTSNGTIFAGSTFGGIFRSTDNGKSWTNVCVDSQYVWAVVVTPRGAIFALAHGGILRSIDSGINWSLVDSGEFHALTVNPSGYVFAGGTYGVSYSTNNGDNWMLANSGLTNVHIDAIASDSNGRIYAGNYVLIGDSSAGGVFRSVNSTNAEVKLAGLSSSPVTLLNNSPNPFTQTTTIRFTLPGGAFTSIKVYDAAGREVAVAASKTFPAGENEVTFDGRALADGVYFYRLETGSGQHAQVRSFVKWSLP